MADYISREAAINEIKEDAGCNFCGLKMATCCLSCSAGKKIIRIRQMPAADVRPVARGKWKHDGSDWKNRFICDQCGYKWFFEAEEAHFCPNCGADMRETGR